VYILTEQTRILRRARTKSRVLRNKGLLSQKMILSLEKPLICLVTLQAKKSLKMALKWYCPNLLTAKRTMNVKMRLMMLMNGLRNSKNFKCLEKSSRTDTS